MVSFPPCKINLGLYILAKRADGYHDIETCFYPIPWTDILEIIPSERTFFTSSGIAIPGNATENLCLRAYNLIASEFMLPPVAIHLHKIIPIGAGLGGGSSDAAYTLKMLNSIFSLRLTNGKLKEYASLLGSDCSFFIDSVPMIGEGRGEKLRTTSVNLHGSFIVIIKPDVHISTAEAYAGVVPKMPAHRIVSIVNNYPPHLWRDVLCNDFEDNIFVSHPLLADIKRTFYEHGALYASMSGSGSSVFGLFNHYVNLKSLFTGMTYWSGSL